VKQREFIRLLVDQGCVLVRHGGRHDLYENRSNGRQAPVPRHNEVKDSLCRLIVKQLGLQK